MQTSERKTSPHILTTELKSIIVSEVPTLQQILNFQNSMNPQEEKLMLEAYKHYIESQILLKKKLATSNQIKNYRCWLFIACFIVALIGGSGEDERKERKNPLDKDLEKLQRQLLKWRISFVCLVIFSIAVFVPSTLEILPPWLAVFSGLAIFGSTCGLCCDTQQNPTIDDELRNLKTSFTHVSERLATLEEKLCLLEVDTLPFIKVPSKREFSLSLIDIDSPNEESKSDELPGQIPTEFKVAKQITFNFLAQKEMQRPKSPPSLPNRTSLNPSLPEKTLDSQPPNALFK